MTLHDQPPQPPSVSFPLVYQTAFALMDQGFCLIEKVHTDTLQPPDFRYLLVNPAFRKHTGLQDVVGKTIREVVPEAEQSILTIYDQVVTTGESRQFEAYVASLDLWMEANVVRISPQPTQLAVLFTNVNGRKRAQDMAATELRDTQLLQALSAQLVSAEATQPMYDQILTAAIALTRADAGTVQLYEAATKELVLLTTRGFERGMTDYFHRVNADSQTACGIALKTNQRTVANFDTNDTDESRRMHFEAGYLSAQSTPLVTRSGTPIGMLNTHWRTARHRPTERELRFLDLLARQAADFIEQRRAAERLHRSAELDAFRLQLADALRPLIDPIAIEETVARILGEHLRADRAYYVKLDQVRQVATVKQEYRRGEAPSLVGEHAFASYGATLEHLQAGGAMVFNDVETDPTVSPVDLPAYRALRLRAFLNTPLIKNGQLVGAMCVVSAEPRRWTTAEIALVEETAQRTWVAIELARAEVALRAAQDRLQLSLKATHTGTFVYHIQADRGEPDARMLALFGLPPNGTLNLAQALTQLIHPDDRRPYAQAVAQATDPAGDGLLQSDIRVEQPDGSLRWISITAQTMFAHKSRQATLMYGVAADITERKQAEERQHYLLRLSDALRMLSDPDELLGQALTQVGDYLDLDRVTYNEIDPAVTHYTVRANYVREGVASKVGVYPMDPFNQTVKDLRRGQTFVVNNAQGEPFSPAEKAIHRGMNVGAYVVVPLVKDGRWLCNLVAHTSQPRDWRKLDIAILEETAERIWAAVERAKAEAALRVSEDKYRTLYQSIDEGFTLIELIVNERGQVVDFIYQETNPAFVKQVGLALQGKRRSELFLDQQDFVLAQYEHLFRTGEPLHFEHQVPNLGGQWFQVTATRMGGEGSKLLGVVFRNITHRKHQEQRQAFLLSLSDRLRSLDDPLAMQQAAIQLVGELLEVDCAFYNEVGEHGDIISMADSYVRGNFPKLTGEYGVGQFGAAMEVLRRGELLIIEDQTTTPLKNASERAASTGLG